MFLLVNISDLENVWTKINRRTSVEQRKFEAMHGASPAEGLSLAVFGANRRLTSATATC